MAHAFYGTRLSEHISTTPEGFLICHDAILCRTAERVPQQYRGGELGLRTDELVKVFRPSEEVLSKKFLASLNGKPATDGHPAAFVDPQNAAWYVKGTVMHVRPGPTLKNGEQAVIGDLMITDASLIDKIRAGLRQLSVGYECKYTDNGDGSFTQRKLRANHVALVHAARGGSDVRILDAEQPPEESFSDVARQYHRVANPSSVHASRKATLDRRAQDGVASEMLSSAEPRSFDDLADEIAERMGPRKPKEEDDEDDDRDSLMAMIRNLTASVEELKSSRSSKIERADLEEVGDASPLVKRLSVLRPFIEKSGDRKAIDAFNTAMRAAKRMSSNLVSAVDQFSRVTHAPQVERQVSFVDAANRIGAKLRGEEVGEEPSRAAVRAEDAWSSDADPGLWGRCISRKYHRQKIR